MQSSRQSPTSTFRTIFLIAIITLVVAVLPVRAQNAAPPTWRGAPVQAFAPPPGTPRVGRKPPVPARTQSRRGWPLDNNALYENGPVDGQDLGWAINFGFTVSDSMQATGPATGMQFWVWLIPGDTLTSAEVQIGAAAFGNELFDQTLNFTASNCFSNQFGYNVCLESANFTGPTLSGNAWLTLSNASVPSGDPAYWDMNSGVGCGSPGCPSQAQENTIGTVPSEAFTLLGNGSSSVPCIYDQPQDGFNIIHDFTNDEAGQVGPSAGVAIDTAGNLYGSTGSGGDYGQGLIYKLAENAGDWVLNRLYSFAGGSNGDEPGDVILGPQGILYGGAGGGIQNCGSDGTTDCGLVYSLRPSPTTCRAAPCSWSENVLYRFSGNTDAWGGIVSTSDSAGNLYGISEYGGAFGHGTVYELTSSHGSWTEKILYSFTGGSDGNEPDSLVMGHDGNLYGLTWGGGDNSCSPPYGCGVVFQLTATGGVWTESVIHTFSGDGDIVGPSGLIQDSSGNLYGNNEHNSCINGYCDYYGMIFELSRANGGWDFAVLYDAAWGHYEYDTFNAQTIDAAGNFFGTGGSAYPYGSLGYIFELADDRPNYLVSFYLDDDVHSIDVFYNLTLDANDNIYGTTARCGQYNKGTIWKLSR